MQRACKGVLGGKQGGKGPRKIARYAKNSKGADESPIDGSKGEEGVMFDIQAASCSPRNFSGKEKGLPIG